jgi:hypothetical protein
LRKGEVPAGSGQGIHVIGKTDFRKNSLKILAAAGGGPYLVGGACVPGKQNLLSAVVNDVANGGYDVIDGTVPNFKSLKRHVLSDGNKIKQSSGLAFIHVNFGKIGPQNVVQHMLMDIVQNRGRAPEIEDFSTLKKSIFDEKTNVLDVVNMGVGNKNICNGLLLSRG